MKDFINAIFFKLAFILQDNNALLKYELYIFIKDIYLNTYKICPFKEAQIDTEDELCLSLILDLLQGKFISFQSLFICSLIFNFKKFNQECIIKQL